MNYFQTTENYDCCSSDVCSVRPASPARRRARRDICFQHSLVLSLARRGRSLHNVSSSLTVLPLRGRGRERGGAALSLGDKCKFVECEQKKASGKYNARKPSIIAYCLSGALFSPAERAAIGRRSDAETKSRVPTHFSKGTLNNEGEHHLPYGNSACSPIPARSALHFSRSLPTLLLIVSSEQRLAPVSWTCSDRGFDVDEPQG